MCVSISIYKPKHSMRDLFFVKRIINYTIAASLMMLSLNFAVV